MIALNNVPFPAIVDSHPKVVYWHREFPPLEAGAMGEHTVEATSRCVPGTLAYRDELCNRCETTSWHRPAPGWEMHLENLVMYIDAIEARQPGRSLVSDV